MLPYRFIIFDLDIKYDFPESFLQNVFPKMFFFFINLPFRELGDLSPGLLLVGSPRIFLVVESKVKQRHAKAISGVAMSPRLFLSMLYKASLNTYRTQLQYNNLSNGIKSVGILLLLLMKLTIWKMIKKPNLYKLIP